MDEMKPQLSLFFSSVRLFPPFNFLSAGFKALIGPQTLPVSTMSSFLCHNTSVFSKWTHNLTPPPLLSLTSFSITLFYLASLFSTGCAGPDKHSVWQPLLCPSGICNHGRSLRGSSDVCNLKDSIHGQGKKKHSAFRVCHYPSHPVDSRHLSHKLILNISFSVIPFFLVLCVLAALSHT